MEWLDKAFYAYRITGIPKLEEWANRKTILTILAVKKTKSELELTVVWDRFLEIYKDYKEIYKDYKHFRVAGQNIFVESGPQCRIGTYYYVKGFRVGTVDTEKNEGLLVLSVTEL